MTKNGSDKGNGIHNYTIEYFKQFNDQKLEIKNVFELGIGTTNPKIPANMGQGGTPSASLRGWREYFPNATIYGADIDETILKDEERIKTFYVDQRDKISIEEMWNQESLKNITFDLIIDDGEHNSEANISFLTSSLDKLNKNGVYYIEDIHNNHITITKYIKGLDILRETIDLNYEIINWPLSKNKSNNCLIKITHITAK